MSRLKLAVAGGLAAMALGAFAAPSASAFSWWVGSNPKTSEILGEGVKVTFSNTATVKSPFTFKVLGEYEIKCAAAKYSGLYIEGLVFLGAASIAFESCTMAKPAGFTLAGGQIITGGLRGEIKPNGAKVEFGLASSGGPIAVFQIESTELECPVLVSLGGTLGGLLSNPSKLSKEKSFVFHSTALTFAANRNCGAAPISKKRKKKHKEEGEGTVEGNKGNTTYSSEASFWSAH